MKLLTRLCLILALAGCARLAPAEPRAPVVLAAASLQEALTAAADSWASQEHPRPTLSFAASSALARQVEAGAPADLFVSADSEWMDYLAARRLVRPGSRANLATNRLILIAPAASRARVAMGPRLALAPALGVWRLAMADPDSVPAGRYGREALTRLGAWPQVAARLARAENVRAALALVARGEAPLGVVYATDARAEPRVRIIAEFPAASHTPIVYPVAGLARAANPEGEAFRRFLLSPQGQAILRRFGFGAP